MAFHMRAPLVKIFLYWTKSCKNWGRKWEEVKAKERKKAWPRPTRPKEEKENPGNIKSKGKNLDWRKELFIFSFMHYMAWQAGLFGNLALLTFECCLNIRLNRIHSIKFIYISIGLVFWWMILLWWRNIVMIAFGFFLSFL